MPAAPRHLKEGYVYEGTVTLDEWRKDLAHLRLMDTRAEALRKTWYRINVIVGVVLVACILFGLVALESLPRGSYAVVLGVPAILLVIGLIRHAAVKRHDAENRRYELAGALLELLARDLERGEPFYLQLGMLPADHPSKDRQRLEVNGWHVTAYTDPWLTLRGRLLDGTRFTLTVREQLQQRTRWKRTARGKYKQKEKTKQGARAALKLRPDAEKLERLRAAAAGKPALRLPPEARVEGLAVEDDAALLQAFLPGKWTPGSGGGRSALDLLALMFIGMYQLMGEAPAAAQAP